MNESSYPYMRRYLTWFIDGIGLRLTLVLFGVLALTVGVCQKELPSYEVETDVDSTDLAYEFVKQYEQVQSERSAIGTSIRALDTAVLPDREIRVLRALNVPEDYVGRPRFSTFTNPHWKIIEEHPLDGKIGSWEVFTHSVTGERVAFGSRTVDDTMAVFLLHPRADSFQHMALWSIDQFSTPGPFAVTGAVVLVSDYDFDGYTEAFVYSGFNREHRTLHCIELETWREEWRRPIANTISTTNVLVLGDSTEQRVVFGGGNPKNQASDSIFSDLYAVIGMLDTRGKVVRHRLTAYAYWGALVAPQGDGQHVYCAHKLPFLPPDSMGHPEPTGFYVSRLDTGFNVIDSVYIDGDPINIQASPFGPDEEPAVWVFMRNQSSLVFDTTLQLLARVDIPPHIQYNGRIHLRGEAQPGYVFNDGIYNVGFEKVMAFPWRISSLEVGVRDQDGRAVDILVNGGGHYATGTIVKRGFLQQLNVFYHRNEQVILMILSGLLVGLIVTNVFRRRTKRNLDTIAMQKDELEEAHEELRAMQARLIEAEKYRQAKDIAGGFAHEIRNALYPAEGSVNKLRELAKAERLDSERLQKYTDWSEAAIQRALNLTKLISEYTSLEARRDPEPVNFGEAVRAVVADQRVRINEAGVEVRLEGPDDARVLINGEQLHIVLRNLLVNSLDALTGQANPRILITWRIQGGTLRAEVTDNGAGIPEHTRERIFDTFFSTKPATGSGLGLAMTRKIIELYGGSIAFESDPGRETTFSVTLSLAD